MCKTAEAHVESPHSVLADQAVTLGHVFCRRQGGVAHCQRDGVTVSTGKVHDLHAQGLPEVQRRPGNRPERCRYDATVRSEGGQGVDVIRVEADDGARAGLAEEGRGQTGTDVES